MVVTIMIMCIPLSVHWNDVLYMQQAIVIVSSGGSQYSVGQEGVYEFDVAVLLLLLLLFCVVFAQELSQFYVAILATFELFLKIWMRFQQLAPVWHGCEKHKLRKNVASLGKG